MSKANRVQNRTKCDMVVEELRNSIVRGDYKTGDRLPPESMLCEQFGVSRITIRESLKKLNMMGIVSIQQGRGTFVENIDLALFLKPMYQLIDFESVDISTIYDARLYVECGSCRLAAINRTPEHLTAIHNALLRFKDSLDHGDIEKGTVYDTDFHVAIAEASCNPLIKAMLLTIEDISNACVRRKGVLNLFMDMSYEHHNNIYDAIKAQDPDEAEKWITLHTMGSKEFLNSI
ncbi:MAG: FadR/GntR family transcriptional regulator [Christensenellales bacterium]|jgi:GntR family transcriptional repressor for pyruvate dehydrogenase complex